MTATAPNTPFTLTSCWNTWPTLAREFLSSARAQRSGNAAWAAMWLCTSPVQSKSRRQEMRRDMPSCWKRNDERPRWVRRSWRDIDCSGIMSSSVASSSVWSLTTWVLSAFRGRPRRLSRAGVFLFVGGLAWVPLCASSSSCSRSHCSQHMALSCATSQ